MQAIVDTIEYRKTGEYNHHVTHYTPSFGSLSGEDRTAIIAAFYKAERGDHHYTIKLGTIKTYFCENGQGYTAMLPEDY